MREAGADGAAQSKVQEDAGDGRPEALDGWVLPIPAAAEGFRRAAVGDHDAHGQAAGGGGVVKRRGCQDGLDGGKEFLVVREGQAAHEDRAGEELFVGGLDGELGEEVHR
jgi:hypothetical protein